MCVCVSVCVWERERWCSTFRKFQKKSRIFVCVAVRAAVRVAVRVAVCAVVCVAMCVALSCGTFRQFQEKRALFLCVLHCALHCVLHFVMQSVLHRRAALSIHSEIESYLLEKEPSLCWKEPSLCWKEPSLCWKEPSHFRANNTYTLVISELNPNPIQFRAKPSICRRKMKVSTIVSQQI